MKTTMKKLLMVVLLLSIVSGGVLMPKQASAKTVSKVTKVFTLTANKKLVKHKLSINTKEKVLVKVKFLEVKGKVLVESEEDLFLGEYLFKMGKGSFFSYWSRPSKLKKSSFKKGKILTSKDDYINGKSKVEWYIPQGIKKLKMQVTYYTKSGKAGIKSVK